MSLSPHIVERLSFKVWPAKPLDYSLATVNTRWEAMEASYRAQRIKEYAEAVKAKGATQ